MNTLRFTSKQAGGLSPILQTMHSRLMMVVMLIFLGQSVLSAESITCRGNVEIGFGPWCKITLSASQFVSNPSGVYTFQIVGTDVSVTLPYELEADAITFNQTYEYAITNRSGVTCDNGKLTFRDYSPPTCGTFDPIVYSFCTSDDVTASFTGPNYSDCSSLTVNHVDVVEDDCDFEMYNGYQVVKKITRSWSALDAFGNQTVAACSQSLYILSPGIDDVKVERTVSIACDKNISIADAIHPDSLDISMAPHVDIDGMLMPLDALCKYAVTMIDSAPVPYAGNKVKVFRTWYVTNWCTGQSRSFQQTLVFIDEVAPEIIVADSITLEANIFSDSEFKLCGAIGNLPLASATDNCSEDTDIEITIYVPHLNTTLANGAILPSGLPLGDNDVIYTAKDACGITATKTINVKVVDTTKPVAICTPTKNIGITNGASTSVASTEFENGSTDNCCIDRFEVRRSDGSEVFSSHVEFYCTDDVVEVIFRAFDCAGNYNDCTLEVTVQDLIRPEITAPAAVLDSCTNVVGLDLESTAILQDRYGLPTVSDNCDGATFVENTPVITDRDCQGKDILRSFYGMDAYGNRTADTVHQLVSIAGVSSFEVVFPDYVEVDCSDEIPVTNPIVMNMGCGEIFTRYQDVIYNQDQGACYKLIRTWEVLDWCAFDISQSSDGGQVVMDPSIDGETYSVTDGYIKYVQEIRVVDSEAPVIASAPEDIEVNLINDCKGSVIIPSPSVSDNNCNGNTQVMALINGDQVIIGSELHGTVGETYEIQYQAIDGCQNRSEIVTTVITFVDKVKPTPICLSLSTELGAGGQVQIWANDFESGSSYDNCELSSVALINKIVDIDNDGDFLDDVIATPPSGQTSITFDCKDEGNQYVQYWIRDMAGNWEFCVTGIFITDADDDDCSNLNGNTGAASVSGSIQTADGENIEQVEVHINNPSMPSIFTGFDGFFSFIGLGSNQEYTVTPTKDIADDNGISTYDMVLLQRHILGVVELDSPYKIMAADVNNSGGISTGDIVEMRKLILGINDKLTKTDSWKFIPSEYVFEDPTRPFSGELPGSLTVMSDSEVEFIGYKMGDLNLNANSSNLLGDGLDGTLELWLEDKKFVAGEKVQITLHTAEAANLLGLGLDIGYDASLLSFDGLQSESLNGLQDDMYYDHPIKEGSVQLAWYDAYASILDIDAAVVTLRFTALADADIQSSLSIKTGASSTAVVDDGLDLIEQEVITNIKEVPSEIKLFQNEPNPFTSETMIRFDLPIADHVDIEVMDISGRLVYSLSSNFSSGEHQVYIQSHDLASTGVFYYRIRTGDFIETKKFIHIK